MSMWRKRILAMAAIPAALLFMPSGAEASHQWSNYHWERDGIAVRDVTVANKHDPSSIWDGMFGSIVNDWNSSAGAYLTVREPGPDESADVESVNADYGDIGWLGMAQIWISRGKYKHITRGKAHENDYYTNLSYFDDTTEQMHVLCQEIGHTFGLDHNRDGLTGGSPDNTCMNDQVWPQYLTNGHDMEQLESEGMYFHDHGGGGGGKEPKCHPKFGCPGAAVGHAFWAEHYETDAELFDAADAVVDATVLSSNFNRMVGPANSSVPVTRVVLRVEDALGGFTRPVIVLEQTRGAGLEIVDDPGYVQGDSYTLYLREIGNNTYRTVNPDGRIRN